MEPTAEQNFLIYFTLKASEPGIEKSPVWIVVLQSAHKIHIQQITHVKLSSKTTHEKPFWKNCFKILVEFTTWIDILSLNLLKSNVFLKILSRPKISLMDKNITIWTMIEVNEETSAKISWAFLMVLRTIKVVVTNQAKEERKSLDSQQG